jgi:hypothetical protein
VGIVPKWSSTLAVSIHPDFDASYGIEHGYFTNCGKAYFEIVRNMFKSLGKHGFIFFFFAFTMTVIATPILLLISIVFFALIILDFIGWIVGMIRKFVVTSSESMAGRSGAHAVNVVAMPILLTLFVPVYVLLLLIPKIATYDEA